MLLPSLPGPDIRAIDDLARASLESFRDACFSWLIACAVVVALGVALEGPEVFHETAGMWRGLRHKFNPQGHPPAWITSVALIGWILVALGVAGEVIADSFVSRADGYIQRFDEIILVDAEQKAGSAQSSAYLAAAAARTATGESGNALTLARGARHEADSFRRDIIAVKQQSTDLQSHLTNDLERTKRLEGQLTWRSVSPEQVEVLKRYFCQSRFPRLLPFIGKKVGLSYVNGDAEAGEYAEELAASLRSTLGRLGAEIIEPTSVTVFGNGPPQTGLILQARDAHDALGVALQNGLREAGVDAPGEITQGIPNGDVGVFVALKPKGWAAKSSAEIDKALDSLPACGI